MATPNLLPADHGGGAYGYQRPLLQTEEEASALKAAEKVHRKAQEQQSQDYLQERVPNKALSFSGTNVHATCFIPPDRGVKSIDINHFKRFAELQTITISSARGVAPVRALGEHWVRDYVKGTRTFAGTLIFSVLEHDVFGGFYHIDRRDTRTPYVSFVDQLPPFTIGLHAINEAGKEASMFLYGVTLSHFGESVSVDDIFLETTYNYVAKWVTPFMPGDMVENLRRLSQLITEDGSVTRASALLFDGVS